MRKVCEKVFIILSAFLLSSQIFLKFFIPSARLKMHLARIALSNLLCPNKVDFFCLKIYPEKGLIFPSNIAFLLLLTGNMQALILVIYFKHSISIPI